MASVASRTPPLPRLGSLPRGAAIPALLLLALLVVSVVLRTRALGGSLWMDEGLSIGIATQPLFDIPHVLRVDGSPPLYYMLLSVWMDVIGRGPAETQGLSVAIAVLTVPAALWSGWSLFGRRAGLIAAALAAVNPFLTAYAQETRMYSLMLLLSLLVTTAFLHVFALRRRRYLPAFMVLLALMLYTHNWGLFVAAGAFVALVPCWWISEDRRAFVRDAALGFGGAGLLYLPWLPTLIHQVQHTGAPWLNPPRFGAPIQIVKSLLGGGTPSVALLLAGGTGLVALLRRRVQDRERSALVAATVLCVATLAVAWLFSQVSPAWTTRYLGVALGPILILASLGLARAGTLGLVALVIVFGVWAVPKTYGLKNKSNASDLREAAVPQLHPGDLVVSMQPEQGPLLWYHLEHLGHRTGLRYATPIGPTQNRMVMDWTDSQDRLEAATPARNLDPLLDRLPAGHKVLLVHPVTERVDDWDAPWTQLVRRRSAQWGYTLARDRRFRRIGAVPPFYRRATRIGIRGVLYVKAEAR
ncbi:MAG: glycosyltransferase family 39 protein [Thermoleophilaceae bacterium]